MQSALIMLPIKAVMSGAGAASRMAGWISEQRCTRVVLVTSRSLQHAPGAFEWLRRSLAPLSLSDPVFVRSHARRQDVVCVGEALAAYRADAVIGFGGGSVFDVVKAALNARLEQGQPLPLHAALPTTLSGSEFAHYFGVTETTESGSHKVSFADPAVVARVIALDAEATLYTPDPLWTSSGLKSLDHAIEGLIGSPGLPILETQLQRGIRRMAANLARSRDPNEIEARREVLLAAWENYFAPASMILGLSHRIGHVLGGRYAVPHGITSAITLAHVCRAAAPFRPRALSLAARALDTSSPLDLAADGEAAPEGAADKLAHMVDAFGLPARLSEVGLDDRVPAAIATEIVHAYPAVLPAVGILATDASAVAELQRLLSRME